MLCVVRCARAVTHTAGVCVFDRFVIEDRNPVLSRRSLLRFSGTFIFQTAVRGAARRQASTAPRFREPRAVPSSALRRAWSPRQRRADAHGAPPRAPRRARGRRDSAGAVGGSAARHRAGGARVDAGGPAVPVPGQLRVARACRRRGDRLHGAGWADEALPLTARTPRSCVRLPRSARQPRPRPRCSPRRTATTAATTMSATAVTATARLLPRRRSRRRAG